MQAYAKFNSYKQQKEKGNNGEKELNSEGSELICDRCGSPIDDCKCVCPYCGESSRCECCVGPDKATGG